MKSKLFFLLLISLGIFQSYQSPAQETLSNYSQARKFAGQAVEQLLFSQTVSPNYFNKGTGFWYEYKTSQGKNWYVVDPAMKKKQALFDLEELAIGITSFTKDPFDAKNLPLRNLALEEDDFTFTFNIATSAKDTIYFTYNYTSHRLDTCKKKDAELRWGNVSPDKKQVIYAKNLNLYYMSFDDYEKLRANPKDSTITETALTTDGVEDFAFGMSRNRMNTDSLLNDKRVQVRGSWSPSGRYFITSLTDSRQVKDLWVINSIANPRPTLETYKYQIGRAHV